MQEADPGKKKERERERKREKERERERERESSHFGSRLKGPGPKGWGLRPAKMLSPFLLKFGKGH